MIEPRELAHSDDALQAALVKALEDNAMLRRALEERSLAPRVRRWVGRTIAGLLFALGLAIGALYIVYSRSSSDLRRGFDDGYNRRAIGGGPGSPARATPPAASGIAVPPAPPAPPATPAPSAPY